MRDAHKRLVDQNGHIPVQAGATLDEEAIRTAAFARGWKDEWYQHKPCKKVPMISFGLALQVKPSDREWS